MVISVTDRNSAVDLFRTIWDKGPMIKNTSSPTPTLPKGCIYRVNGYINNKIKYHIINRRNEVMAWGFKTYADAVAKAIEMDKHYKAVKKALKQRV